MKIRNAFKTQEQYIVELSEKNPEITPLDQYAGAHTSIKHQCLKCGNIWSAAPTNLLRGHGCPKCSIEDRSMSNDEFISKLSKIKPTIRALEPYNHTVRKVKCECLVCGNIWIADTSTLLNSKKGCLPCGKKRTGEKLRLGNDLFLQKLHDINPFVEPLEEITTTQDKIKCKCTICGYIWDTKPNNLLNGHGCALCGVQTGEKQIACILIDHNISFTYEKTFENLIGTGGGLLSYDFYLPQYNALIEYQGEQHYKAVDCFGGEERFIQQQEHDRRKREYAIKNGFKFLEIKYDEDTKEKTEQFLQFISVETTGAAQ